MIVTTNLFPKHEHFGTNKVYFPIMNIKPYLNLPSKKVTNLKLRNDLFIHMICFLLFGPLYIRSPIPEPVMVVPNIIYMYIYSMVVGYDGVGFAQGPASLRRSYAVIGSVCICICYRICGCRDAGPLSYLLIYVWRCWS